MVTLVLTAGVLLLGLTILLTRTGDDQPEMSAASDLKEKKGRLIPKKETVRPNAEPKLAPRAGDPPAQEGCRRILPRRSYRIHARSLPRRKNGCRSTSGTSCTRRRRSSASPLLSNSIVRPVRPATVQSGCAAPDAGATAWSGSTLPREAPALAAMGSGDASARRPTAPTNDTGHWRERHRIERRYECEPPGWGHSRYHREFRCNGHAITCNFCGNTGRNPGKVRSRVSCSGCQGHGDLMCRRCAGAGVVDRVARKVARAQRASHELRLKNGQTLRGRVIGETKEMVFFKSGQQTRTYRRSEIKELKRLPSATSSRPPK